MSASVAPFLLRRIGPGDARAAAALLALLTAAGCGGRGAPDFLPRPFRFPLAQSVLGCWRVDGPPSTSGFPAGFEFRLDSLQAPAGVVLGVQQRPPRNPRAPGEDRATLTADGRRLYLSFSDGLHGSWMLLAPRGADLSGTAGDFSDTFEGLRALGKVLARRIPCSAGGPSPAA